VQLWNRALLDNLHYGVSAAAFSPLDQVLDAADLRDLLEKLPDGLQTPLGEGSALVSGGEGQWVRLGRGLLRPGVRLVILDELFRGLGHERCRELLARARCWWQAVTLLCITHDVGETQGFDRVLVVEAGQIVEDGVPADLATRPDSRYRALLEAEREVREGLWSSNVAPLAAEVDRLLIEADVPRSRRARSRAAILREQLGPGPIGGGGWLLRLPPGANFWQQVRQARLPSCLFALVGRYAGQYLLWLLTWWMLGQGALQGCLDLGWLLAWALLLVTLVPFRLLAIGLGGMLLA
jgi:hypothetical protein